MDIRFCPNCKQNTCYQRHIGFGTILLIIITSGAWILAIPFYKKKCKICGCEQFDVARSGKR